MIKSNELRIGNLLYWVNEYDQSKGITIVRSASEDGIDLSPDTEYGNPTITAGYEFKNLEGIPITHEIYKNCGIKTFYKPLEPKEVETINAIEVSDSVWLVIHPEQIHIHDIRWNQTIHLRIDCKYVHQLQNLFYSLTGKELQITL